MASGFPTSLTSTQSCPDKASRYCSKMRLTFCSTLRHRDGSHLDFRHWRPDRAGRIRDELSLRCARFRLVVWRLRASRRRRKIGAVDCKISWSWPPARWAALISLRGCEGPPFAERSTLRPGQPEIALLLRQAPAHLHEAMSSIQPLQQTAAAMTISRDSTVQRAAAAAELWRSARR